jgi:hypothetical protein
MTQGGSNIIGDKQRSEIEAAVGQIVDGGGEVILDGLSASKGGGLAQQMAETGWLDATGIDLIIEDLQSVTDTLNQQKALVPDQVESVVVTISPPTNSSAFEPVLATHWQPKSD